MTDIDGNWQGGFFYRCPRCGIKLDPPATSDEDNIDNLDFDKKDCNILDHIVDNKELDPPEEG